LIIPSLTQHSTDFKHNQTGNSFTDISTLKVSSVNGLINVW